MRKILVPLDGSAFAEQAIDTARAVADRTKAAVEFIVVHEPEIAASRIGNAPPRDPRLDADVRASLRRYLDRLEAGERRRSTLAVTGVFRDGRAADEIARQVVDGGADLVVMTTHGRGGLERLWLGSVADRVVRSATAPVLLVRVGADVQAGAAGVLMHRVVVALAGADQDDRVIEAVLDVTDPIRTRYTLAHVVPPSPLLAALEPEMVPPPDELAAVPHDEPEEKLNAAERYLEWMARPLRARGSAVETVVEHAGSPARALLKVVEDASADLIVVGTAARGPLARLFMGSVADKVVRHSPCSVLVCPVPTAEG